MSSSSESELQLKKEVFSTANNHQMSVVVERAAPVSPGEAASKRPASSNKLSKKKKAKSSAPKGGGIRHTERLVEKFDREGLCKVIAMIRSGELTVSSQGLNDTMSPEERTKHT